MKFLLTLALLLPFYAAAQQPPPPAMPDRNWYFMNMDSLYKAVKGKKYLDFDVTTTSGKHINNQSCLGKVTFINFWFEGCGPCRGEFGDLNTVYDSLANNPDFQFVAITFDDPKTLPEFVQKNKLHYPVATVPSTAESKRLDFRMGYPNSIILDKKGRIAYIGMKAISDVDGEYKISVNKIFDIINKELNK